MDEFIACELNLNKGIIQKRCNYKEKEKGKKEGGKKRKEGGREK